MARRPRPGPYDGRVTEHEHGAAHLIELIRHTLPPVHRAGVPFIAGSALIAALGRDHRWLRDPALAAGLAAAAFFRHPARVPPLRTGLVVAPADGEITLVDSASPPPEIGWGKDAKARISIFLSLFDVHVQRIPVTGDVRSVIHTPGRFLSADLPAASTDNERNSVVISTDSGADIAVVQVAGLLARRIVCDVSTGDRVGVGETYGLIRFGSRVDVYLPDGVEPEVRVGQRAVGGETILARLP